jgi:adenylate cyclase
MTARTDIVGEWDARDGEMSRGLSVDWKAEGLLDGLDDERALEARRKLLDELHTDGCDLDQLRQAVAEDRLALLPVERLLGSTPQYTARDLAEKSGLDLEYLITTRRALGLPVPDVDDVAFGDEELEAANLAVRFREAGFPDDEAIETTRVLAQGLARYAEAIRTLAAETFLEPGLTEYEVGKRYEAVGRELLPLAGPWMEHLFSLHLRNVLRRDAITREELATGRVAQAQPTAVAFADLVGFTALGESVPLEELGGVAARLAKLARDVVEPPVRIVKMIGDAVMLVSPEPADLVETGLRLVEAAEGDDAFPALRVGMAYGEAVNRWGDWFGSPVNVASRLTARARPGSVLVSNDLHDAAGEDGYDWSFAGDKKVKGLSTPVKTWRVRRSSDE